jgi:hypothetical protein
MSTTPTAANSALYDAVIKAVGRMIWHRNTGGKPEPVPFLFKTRGALLKDTILATWRKGRKLNARLLPPGLTW